MDPLILNISPSCPNCLAWSADGILAIAAGDYTHLLVPKISDKDSTSEGQNPSNGPFNQSLWYSVRVYTNKFTFKEWPTQDPLSYKNFSLGEEQSLSKLVGLKWSPEGLGMYRRCVLGVLTSNCVLSLWEADQHPMEAAGWKRIGIVNDALRIYFGTVLGDSNGDDSEESQELRRKKQRVRAFDWSPQYDCESQDRDNETELARIDDARVNRRPPSADPPWRTLDGMEAPEIAKHSTDDRKWGLFYLALTNDDNDIVFARLHRERCVPNVKSGISVEILSHVHLPFPPSRGSALSSDYSLNRLLATPTHIRQISWGPWSEGGSRRSDFRNGSWERKLQSSSLISFIQGTRLQFYRIKLIEIRRDLWSEIGENEIVFDIKPAIFVLDTADLSTPSFDGTVLWCRDGSDIANPLTERARVLREEGKVDETTRHHHLVATSNASVTLFTFPSILYRHDHKDGKDCELCDDDEEEDTGSLRLSITRRDLTSKQVGEGRFQRVLWDRVMGVTFTRSEMMDKAEYKLHAAATSSCSEVMRISVSDSERVHPRVSCLTLEADVEEDWIHQIEIAKDKFDREHDLGGLTIAKISGIASNGAAIAVCFTLHPGDLVEYTTAADEMMTIAFADHNPNGPEFSISRQTWASKSIKRHFFLSDPPELGADHETFLEHMAQQDEDESLLKQNKSIQPYVQKILPWVLFSVQPGTRVAHDKRSLQIVHNAMHFLSEIELQWGTDRFNRLTRLNQLLHNAERWLFYDNAPGRADELSQTERVLKEHCNICKAELAWHTYEEARCENGHSSKRCALTLLAIQEPGIVKYCSACEREYLNEEEIYHEYVKEQKAKEKRHFEIAQSATAVITDEMGNRDGEVTSQGADKDTTFTETLLWKIGKFFDICPFCHAKFYC